MRTQKAKPPRNARTRCKVAPPSSWYSAAVFSSVLYLWIISEAVLNFRGVDGGVGGVGRKTAPKPRSEMICRVMRVSDLKLLITMLGKRMGHIHLLSAKDQTLLYGWDAFLFLNLLLDLRHLPDKYVSKMLKSVTTTPEGVPYNQARCLTRSLCRSTFSLCWIVSAASKEGWEDVLD